LGIKARLASPKKQWDFVRVIFMPLAERHIDSLHASEERADGYVDRIVDF